MPNSEGSTTENEKQFKLKESITGTDSDGSCLKYLALNLQSLNNKCTLLMEHVIDHDAGVVFLCETWLKSKKNSTTAMFEEFGYKLYHDIRMGRAKEGGGGVGILVKSIFHARPVKSIQYQTYEHSILNLRTTNCGWLTLVSVYRLDYEPISLFFEEFSSLLESLAASYGRYIIAGDINIHCDDLNDNHTYNSFL